MFPIITHINDLRPHVEHMEEVRFSVQPNGYTVVSVMVTKPDTYSGENAPYVRECRGITFDRDGFIVSRGLHKFFNVNERDETRENVLNWDKIEKVQEKRDGSVINPVIVDGNVVFKSKKSFDSDVAILANKTASLNDKIFSEFCLNLGLSPTFELTSPYARIVVKYPESKLTLLHIRENHSGRYLSHYEIARLTIDYDIETVYEFSNLDWFDWNKIKSELEIIENFEGYCIQFEDGEIVKVKSEWYKKRHHAMTALTYRNVAEAVVNETVDDLKSYIFELQEPELFDKIKEIEDAVSKKVFEIMHGTNELAYIGKQIERKEFAIQYSKHKFFGLAIKVIEGKEPNYYAFYERHYLKSEWEPCSL